MKLTRRTLLAAPAVLTLAGPGLARANDSGPERARRVVHDLMTAAPFPAASVAVWQGGGLVWAEAFGMADLETALPATTQDRFRLASVSKVLTAAAVMRLVERGVVDLDMPIGHYRKGLPEPHRGVTLRQLVSHQAGLRHYIPRDHDPLAPGGSIDTRTYATTDDKLAIFINDPLISIPGEVTHYSTFGYVLIGAVLEWATGKAFPRILADEVTRPLALVSIVPEVRGQVVPERVCDYQPVLPARGLADIIRCPPINPAYKWPGGGLLGSATDVARFCGNLMQPGYLGEATRAEMFTINPLRGGGGVFGIGWDMDRDPQGRRRGWHAGSIVGGRSIVMVLPDDGVAVTVLTNLGQIDVDPLAPAQRIANIFLG